MAQYIDKTALVAEIERRIEEVSQIEKASYEIGLCDAYKTIISFLDTFEVREVDLKHEIEKVKKMQRNFELKNDTIIEFLAKHFFELGLCVNNPITAADKGIAEEIIINLKRVEQDYHLDLTREMEWLRNKTNKL